VKEAKANVEAKTKEGNTALHIACRYDNRDVVKHLVKEAKANVEAKPKEGDTALHIACRYGNIDVVEHLVEEVKANVEARNNEGKKPVASALLKLRRDIDELSQIVGDAIECLDTIECLADRVEVEATDIEILDGVHKRMMEK